MRYPVFGRVDEPGPPAAGKRRADQLADRIIVGGIRILVQIQPGEARRSLTCLPHRGIRQAEEIKVRVAFAVVHPVVVAVELLVDLSVLGELPGHRVQSFRDSPWISSGPPRA